MAPRTSTLPPAATQSAKAARAAFFCALCQKGYSRMNEFEAHESSYDHQHKKRLKEMKEMQKQVQPKPKEEKSQGVMMQIKLGGGKSSGGGGGGGGFKKGGFKNAFSSVEGEAEGTKEEEVEGVEGRTNIEETVDSDVTDDEDDYDPRKPTGCMPGCGGRTGPGHV